MTLTVLEKYAAIIFTLSKQGPLKTDQLEAITHIDKVTLENCLIFLYKQGTIEKRRQPKEAVAYAVTTTGLKIVDFFRLSKTHETH